MGLSSKGKWNIGWGGGMKNGAKIKIDQYFFVKIEKKNPKFT